MTVILPGVDNLLSVIGDPKLYKERLEAIQTQTNSVNALIDKYLTLKREVEEREKELKDKQDMLYEADKRNKTELLRIDTFSENLNKQADELTERRSVVSILEKEAAKTLEALQISEGSLSKREKDFQKRSDDLAQLEAKALAKAEAMDTKEKKLKEIING
jgi:DNA repair ATPase RecN